MADRGDIQVQVISFLNARQRDEKSANDSTAHDTIDECWQNFMTDVEQSTEQSTMNTDIQCRNVSSSQLEAPINASPATTVCDLDQCLEDLENIFPCCDFCPTDVVNNLPV